MANIKGNKTNTFAVTAGTKPVLLSASNDNRVSILVVNAGSVTVYITGKQSDAYTQGIPVVANQSYSNDTTTAELWVVTSSSTSDVRVQEDGN